MSDGEAWMNDYLTLDETERKLRDFMQPRKELLLKVAVEHVNGLHSPGAMDPCDRCVPVVGSYHPATDQWYFEWACKGWHGRCDADTCGWLVPVRTLAAGIARHLAS